MSALQAEAAGYPEGVRIWMRVMAVSFFGGIIFAPWRREALWVVLMAFATLVLLVAGKILDPSLSRSLLGSIIHLVLWPIILFLLWSPAARNRRQARGQQGYPGQIYFVWLLWVSAVIVVSLVLDARYVVSYAASI